MKKLNEKEEQVMQIMWRLGRAFVKEILAEIPDPKPPITTLSSLVRKMEGEGWLGHESFGKTHRYYPVVEKADYLKFSFTRMVKHYFDGSPAKLLSFFVNEEDVAPEELDRLLDEIKKDDA